MKLVIPFLWGISLPIGLYLVFIHSSLWGLAFLFFFSLDLKPKHGFVMRCIVLTSFFFGLVAIYLRFNLLKFMLLGGLVGLFCSPLQIRLIKKCIGSNSFD
jgi:hypothetical protein